MKLLHLLAALLAAHQKLKGNKTNKTKTQAAEHETL